MLKKTLVVMSFIALMVNQANAQSVSLGPQIGYYKSQDADNGSIMGGAALRLKFTPVLGAEASINYRQEKYANGIVTVRSWPVMVTGLLYPFPIVYGAIGAGWYNTTFDYDQSRAPLLTDQTLQQFGWHFGGGLELPVGTNLKLTGDIRYVFLNYKFQTIPGVGEPKSDFFVVTVGLLFDL
jgi:opacity protein-like surface antigen